MAEFIKIPTFDIYEEESGEWAKPEQWWTEGELIYQSDILDDEMKPIQVRVPDHTETDLASIPRFPPLVRTIFLKNGNHRIAAVVHDYLCRQGKNFPRRKADKIFYEAMGLCNVKRIKRKLMYWAVRANTERLILMRKAR